MDGAALVITLIAIIVFGPIITLLWWKIADQWADSEKRRIRREEPPEPPRDRVVVRGFAKPGADPADAEPSQGPDGPTPRK